MSPLQEINPELRISAVLLLYASGISSKQVTIKFRKYSLLTHCIWLDFKPSTWSKVVQAYFTRLWAVRGGGRGLRHVISVPKMWSQPNSLSLCNVTFSVGYSTGTSKIDCTLNFSPRKVQGESHLTKGSIIHQQREVAYFSSRYTDVRDAFFVDALFCEFTSFTGHDANVLQTQIYCCYRYYSLLQSVISLIKIIKIK
jgi:hypothetical protein